jgi:NTE family protein
MPEKTINLALQGGGAHGAVTWGVLDRLLEDERIAIDGICGTSAGAMNAAALAAGWVDGGREAARRALEDFWRAISHGARLSPIQPSPIDRLFGGWNLDASPGYLTLDILTRFMSPAVLNPLGYNPLRDIVAAAVDFDKVRACRELKLFVAATNVQTGKVKVFSGEALTLDAVMASACLPQMFSPVVIDGVPYWDGGFMGNPPLVPLFYETRTADCVLVQVNPIVRREIPVTARDILNRVNEITFNSSLLRELRAITFVTRLIDEGKLDPDEYTRVRMHRISADECLEPLSASSNMNADWSFLTHLCEQGRAAATAWLERHFDDLGSRDTIDLAPEIA